MLIAAVLALFFGGFAAGSLYTASQEYHWRNATEVHGVLVKNGTDYRYEYRPAGKPAVRGPALNGVSSDKPDGVVDDWVPVDYDPNVPEQLRRHRSKGRASTNFRQFLITAGAGAVFGGATLLCVGAFMRAWRDKRGLIPQ
jgi:hypothetical protein